MSEPTAATPDEIREEIEQTRAELGDTVDALTAKLDVKANVKANVKDRVSSAKTTVSDAAGKAKAAVPTPVQSALGQAGAGLNQAGAGLNKAGAGLNAKASPLVEQAKPYGKQIAAGVGALVAALVFVLRRRSK